MNIRYGYLNSMQIIQVKTNKNIKFVVFEQTFSKKKKMVRKYENFVQEKNRIK